VVSRSDIALARPAHRRLLSILLLEQDRAVETEVLIDRVWAGEPPQTAKAALQTYISQLRRALGEGVIGTSDAGYVLQLDRNHLDAREFTNLASRARSAAEAGAWQEVADAAQRAVALWRGAPFVELQGDEFAMPEIARLEELHIQLVELRADALLALGRTEEALPDLERFVVEHPLRERLREHLMVARARLGRVSEALATYQDLRQVLGEMGLEPAPALRELEERILQEDPVLVPPRVRNNLPARLTSFVGRDAELTELRDALKSTRMVTLAGTGGAGKTRLATELAQNVLADHPDGVYLVSFAALKDPTLVATDAAEVLGLRVERTSPANVLTDSLRHRKVLMILDNCEHLLEACAELADVLLQAGPGVSVLATSREPLRVGGEVVYAVPPLAIPPLQDSAGERVATFDAVRLFVDRASLVSRQFRLDEHAVVVADIARRLDGLPLAIELAAAQVRSLPVDVIAERLDHRFQLLADGNRTSLPRQQTLRATIDWSYRLLADEERLLFQRFSVFAGGCTLEAAEFVCSASGGPDESQVLELLSRLIDKSLLDLELNPASSARYRMLQTLREFASDHLAEIDAADLRRRHRDFFLGLAERAIAGVDASDQLAWLDRIHDDRDNLAAALDWSLHSGHHRAVASLAEAIGWYRSRQGHTREGIEHMRLALDHLEPGDTEREAALRARMAGTLYTNGDEEDAVLEATRARDLVIDAPPSAAKVRALTEFASMHQRIVHQDPQVAIAAAKGAIDAARELGDRFAQTHGLRTLGTALAWAGDIDEGIDRLREALRIARELGNAPAVLGVYLRLYVTVLDHARRPDDADALGREIIGWLDAGGDRVGGAASMLAWLSMGFLRSGDSALADELLDRCGRYHNEGMMMMSYLSMRAAVHWMRGRLDEAGAAIVQLRAINPRPRYFRMLFPIEAGILADEGRLDDVRSLVTAHLGADVAQAEEPTKAGTLHVLVRAEIDAALEAQGPMRVDHLRRAETAVRQIRELIAHDVPTTHSGLQLETADTCLLLAEAELSRGTDPRPDPWRALLDRPWYAYWRIYVRCRLGESLLATAQSREAVQQLRLARKAASEMDAEILRDEIDAVAHRAGALIIG
jgi:predicted ATPase/DNA-binding SARP family transcriptional activator